MAIILIMIIERREAEVIRGLLKTKKWVLVYGRRKTGKTFLIQNFITFDEYFFAKKDRTIISQKGGEQKTISYETFLELLQRSLAEDRTMVVDEFHRLGEDFLDRLHAGGSRGKLILVSSTLSLAKKVFGRNSPVLGMFAEAPVGLLSLEDVLKKITREGMGNRELVETALIMREPTTIDYFSGEKQGRKVLIDILQSTLNTIPALVGEIFGEEEKTLSGVYEGVLRAIAGGNVVSTEISSYLFSHGLIKKDDPSAIQQYLNNMLSFGLIKRMRIYNKNKFVYKHVSPLMRIFYYADEKYNISERKPSQQEMERIVDDIMPRVAEDSIREFLSDKLGLEESLFEAKDFDIDACLLRFKEPEVAVEIKWKAKPDSEDVSKASASLGRIKVKRKILFVQDKKLLGKAPEGIEVADILSFL